MGLHIKYVHCNQQIVDYTAIYLCFGIHLIFNIDRACYLVNLAGFVKSIESVSTSGNATKGEDMDACLEEVTKDSKVWQHGSTVAMNWLRIFRNLENLRYFTVKV